MNMTYDQIVYLLDVIVVATIIFFLGFLWYYLSYFVIATKKDKKFPKATQYAKFAVLIPARNESKVIRNILKSFKDMKYPREFFDVFVITETEDDPTNKITDEAGFIHVVRKDLNGRRTKGFALDDCYKYIKEKGLVYDAYMIFDADNIVSEDYLDLMNDVYQQGYQVGVGYRSFTNATKNWICACSGTLFSFMNQFTSKGRSVLFKKATLSGTGYFLDARIVDECGGWIRNGMTEDVQLTTYCYYHNIKMYYYPFAKYYDEQAESFKILNKQHVRWVWGFFASRKTFKDQNIGKVYPPESKVKRFFSILEYSLSIYPFVVLTIVILVVCIISFGFAIGASVLNQPESGWLFAHSIFQFILLYMIFMFTSAFVLGIDNKNLKFSVGKSIVIVLTYMFFFSSFLIAFFRGLFNKKLRSSWGRIEHNGQIIDKQAVEVKDDKKR